MIRRRPVLRRALLEALEGRALLTITPAHVALARRSVAETTVDNNLYTNGAYTVNWAGINGKTATVTKADCTTYVTALLQQSYGWSYNQIYNMLGGTSLTAYYDDAVADDGTGLDGFKQIGDVKVGDYFVCRYLEPDPPARGHMVMFDALPTYAGTTTNKAGQPVKYYTATIIDDTGSPHSLDTRTGANPDGTNDTGIGRGNVRLYTDMDGNIQYWAWGTSSGSTTYDYSYRPCIFFKVPALTINAPTTLVATAADETTVNLSWTDRSGIEDGYQIDRSSDNGGTWTAVGDTAKNVSTFTDTSAVPGSYTYRVYAVAGASQSGVASTTVTVAAVVPTTPSDFAAVLSGTKVNLTWTDTATNEIGYTLERSTNGGAFSTLASLSANADTYVDPSAAYGYRYTYRLAAFTPYAESVEADANLNLAVRRTPVGPQTTIPTTSKTTTAQTASTKTSSTKTTATKTAASTKTNTVKSTVAKLVVKVAKAPVLRSVATDVLDF